MSSSYCVIAREELSAELDGELPGGRSDGVAAHLLTCPNCPGWLATVTSMHRSQRVVAAEVVPDLSRHIMAALATAQAGRAASSRPSLVPMARIALVIVAAASAMAVIPELAHRNDLTATAHGARELGTFELALAVGFAVAAWRPAQARLVAMLGVLVSTGLVLTGAIDMVAGHTVLGIEVHHALELMGTVLTCVIARFTPSAMPIFGHNAAALRTKTRVAI